MAVTHFYTVSDSEAAAAVANMNATHEGTPFWVYDATMSRFVPMYRLLKPASGTHLFTTVDDERDAAINEFGYRGEGIGFWCLPPGDVEGLIVVPLFRGHNPVTQDYLYTLEEREIAAAGYNNEGVVCWVQPEQDGSVVPLLRLRSPGGQHFYTVNPAESASLQIGGYIAEGKCGFVLDKSDGGPQPFYRSYSPATGGHLYTLSIAEHDAASNDGGLRADGIACFIWPDNAHPSTTTKLFRAFNSTLGDHFYTVDPLEYGNAIKHRGYSDEGIAGWVLDAELGKSSESAVPMHRLRGEFADDFLILTPGLPASLSSNSNYMLTSVSGTRVAPVVGISVDIAINSDLTVERVNQGEIGFGFQLNAVPPAYFTTAWHQYVVYVSKGEISCEIQNWAQSRYAIGFVAGAASLGQVEDNTLPAGYRVRIALLDDDFGNILGAQFSVLDTNNVLSQQQLLIKDFHHGTAFGSAPIVAFQLVLVGLADDAYAVLAPGATGLITYSAGVPLRAATDVPSVAGWGRGMKLTAEVSNSEYGQIAATKSKTLRQTFTVDPQSSF